MKTLFNGLYKNRRVLVTGHTGFKGSWLSLWLNLLGAKVTGYALPPLPVSMFTACELDKKISSVIGDIRSPEQVETVFKQSRPEIVFHLAAQALVGTSYELPVVTYDTNIMGTVNLLEACRHSPSVKVVIVVTSDKCYENREWVWGYRENDPMGGYDPYSSSKGCAELVTAAYRQSFFNSSTDASGNNIDGTSVSTARAGNVIGGGDWAKDRIMPDSVMALVKGEPIGVRNPRSIRPWQHVLEPVRGYLSLAAGMWDNGGRFAGGWNFGPSEESAVPVSVIVQKTVDLWGGGTWRDLSISENQQDQSGVKNRLPHEAGFLKLNIAKARHQLNWHPLIDLDKTLAMTVEWYRHYYNTPDTILDFSLKQLHRYHQNCLCDKP